MLRFEKQTWSSDDVSASGLHENESVTIDRRHYENGVLALNTERIEEHFQQHGTWPGAPIFLANLHRRYRFPGGRLCTSPYHLVEGHHRAAIFLSLHSRGEVDATHEVWVISGTDA